MHDIFYRFTAFVFTCATVVVVHVVQERTIERMYSVVLSGILFFTYA